MKKTVSEFFYNSDIDTNGCWLWRGRKDKIGYSRMGFGGRYHKGHRLSWTLYFGDIPQGLSVLHRCDVRHCINPHHLFLGTQADNMKDCANKGRIVSCAPRFGEDNPVSKYTKEQVLEVRRRYASGVKQIVISNDMGMSRMNVNRIVHRKLWGHI